jgi:hypothetical protein
MKAFLCKPDVLHRLDSFQSRQTDKHKLDQKTYQSVYLEIFENNQINKKSRPRYRNGCLIRQHVSKHQWRYNCGIRFDDEFRSIDS